MSGRVGSILLVTLLSGLVAERSGFCEPSAGDGDEAGAGEGSDLREFAKEAGESDTATATESRGAAPAEGPGSLISKEEAEPMRPPTAGEIEAAVSTNDLLRRLTLDLEYYRQGADSFAADMKDLIKIRYDAQKEQIASQYDQAIDGLEKEERDRRLEAIARFEEFLRKYPNDPVYTPDAMFRLAELYFEKSSDEYLVESKNYEKQLVAFERGERPDEPAGPKPYYEKTIGLYQGLLNRFPEYRLADAARYLLGYCYGEQGQIEESLAAYTDVVAKHPDSRFLAEVWTRIGEIYFDRTEPDALEKAIAAYAKVRAFPDSPYYDKALYKIAWTYYRLDRFQEAIDNFIELVEYADEQKRLTGRTGSELRAEAIQYVAVSLADEEWGGPERAQSVLQPHDTKLYASELWKRYGEILYDQARYPDAIKVLEHTLAKHPMSSQNPEVQSKIVNAYEQLRDFDGAAGARENLVSNFSEGSKWFDANRDNKEALATARNLTERSLYSAAIFRHQQAQAYKKESRFEDAKRSYQQAAAAYQTYLQQFPAAKNAYDFEFFLAECLYYSDDFRRAAEQYDRVRDSTMDNKHLEAAALSAVITYEKEIERQESIGQLEKLEAKRKDQRQGAPPKPRPIVPIRMKLIDASDRYVKLLPNSERAPAIAYRAGEVYYVHDQFDEARKRFEAIVARSPGTEVARFAMNWIIETYLATDDFQSVSATSQRLYDLAKGAKEQTTTADEKKAREAFLVDLKKYKLGAEFKLAEKYDAEGNFEESANTYVRLVNENPENEYADKALFNAAVSYEKVKRFETASSVYQRIYDQYPKSELAPRALFRVGVNYEKGFDFASAIVAYGKLIERYPDSEHRADAMYNVAVNLESTQQYAQAAQAFRRYATTFQNRDDAGENFYRAALVYEKMRAWPEMIDTLRSFIGKYKAAPAQRERIVEAHLKVGEAYRVQSDERNALAAYQSCVREFAGRRLPVESPASADAAKCTFQIAEAEFNRYDGVKIAGTGRAQVRALEEKAKLQRQVEKSYTEVFKYKRVETTLAASYRIGHSYERFAEALFAAEVPKEFQGNPELEDEYKRQLEEKAVVLERKAEQAYRKAHDEAKRTRVTNEWTERTLEGLNKYAPKEFPVQRSGKALMQTFTVSGHGLDGLGSGTRSKRPSSPSGSIAPGGIREKRTAEAKSVE